MKKRPSGKEGFVQIAGAGPGDPDLLTVRTLRALESAEVVLFDRLVHPDILKIASSATLIPVGKKRGQNQELRQDRIHRLLVRYAQAGFRVLRLKGGDPFVFGRGGEEALALKEAGIRYEILPGVSSFYSVPELSWIPLTYRGVSASFGVFTGHEAERSSGFSWSCAASMQTAVFLMCKENLARIADRLIAHGRAPSTPAAVISKGSTPEERIVVSTLAEIHGEAASLPSPAMLVVGEVVALRSVLHPGLTDGHLADRVTA